MPTSRGSRGRSGAQRDLLVISLIALAVFCLGVTFEVFDGFAVWAEKHVTDVGDLFAVLLILSVAFVAFAVRRMQQAEREAGLRDTAERRFRTIVERVPAVAYTYDSADPPGSAPVTYISPQIENLLGYTADEWVKDPDLWTRCAHVDDQGPMLEAWADAVSKQATFTGEYRMRTAEGRLIWVREEAVPISIGARGSPIYQGVLLDITEQKRAERSFRELVEELPVVTYLAESADPSGDHTLLYMAPGIEQLSGRSAEEWIAEPGIWVSMLHPDDRERVLEDDRRTDLTGERFEHEYRLVRADGSSVWLRDTAVLVERDGYDKPLWQGFIEDITARREAEQRFIDADRRFRALVEQIPAVTYIEDDPSGDLRYVSPQIEAQLGYTPEEWMANPELWVERIHPDDRERVHASNEAPKSDKWSEEYRSTTKDGRTVWIRNEAVLISDDEGSAQFWIGFSVDITERMVAEEKLRVAEERYRSLVERLPTAVYIDAADELATAIYVSPQFEGLTGYTPAERLSQPDLWVRMLHPDDRDRTLAESNRTNASGDRFDVEYRIIAKDGRSVWLHDLAYLVEGPDGRPAWQGVLTDITERKLAEEAVSRRDRILEAVGLAAERFLGAASWMDVIGGVLQHVGEAGDASRAGVYRKDVDDDGRVCVTLVEEWAAPGVEPFADRTRDVLIPLDEAGLSRWVQLFEAGEIVHGPTQDFPEPERSMLESAGIRALVAMPIMAGGEWWGHLAYDQSQHDRIWQQAELDALRVVANALGAAVGRERATQALSDTQARHQSLIETIPAATYIDTVDAVSKAVYMSPQVEDIFGYTPEEWIGHPELWEQGVHPDDLREVAAKIERLNVEGLPFEAEYRFHRPDGRLVWVHDQAVVIRNEQGEPQVAQGVMFDITERREAEEQLREAEERFRAIVEHVPAAIYLDVPDASMETLYVSPQVEEITGWTAEEWVGDPDLWRDSLLAEDRDEVLRTYLAAVENGSPWSGEYRLLTRGGRTIWVRDETVYLHDEEGNRTLMQGVIFDITELKMAEQALRESERREREAAERLRALDEMKNTFLAAVSHELRSPLTSILGLALTLERSEMPDDDRNDLLERLATNARKLDRLLKDLLDIDRLNRGIVDPQYRVTDVGSLARRAIESLDPLADRSILVFADPVVISVDPAKVERIVENLLMNAARHTAPDRTIWLRVQAERQGVLISVEDDGPGVPPELREVIFEPFRQGPIASPHAPGTGIGLSLVSRFAKLHGGEAWVEDREGGGAAFRVWLPGGPSAGQGVQGNGSGVHQDEEAPTAPRSAAG